MLRVLAIAVSVFEDGIRRKVMYVAAVFAAILMAYIPALPGYGVAVEGALFREVSLALTFAGALVVTLALAVNRVPADVERRTAYAVLARPVARWEYVVGNWFGVALLAGMVIALFTVCDQAVALWRYGDPMWRLWQGSLGVWMEMWVVSAFAVAVSTATGPVPVTVASLTFLFAAHSRSALFAEGDTSIAATLFPSLDPLNVISAVSHGSGIGLAYIGTMLVIAGAWSAVLLIGGSALFARRDL